MQHLVKLFLIVMWVYGIVLAKGFWMTLACVILPLVSWVVVGMHLTQ